MCRGGFAGLLARRTAEECATRELADAMSRSHAQQAG
jgi:hypothetical protein